MVQNRLNAVNEHFGANSNYNGGQVGPQRADDVVIIGMARTAMTKAKRGAQKDTPLEAMLKPMQVQQGEVSGGVRRPVRLAGV